MTRKVHVALNTVEFLQDNGYHVRLTTHTTKTEEFEPKVDA